MAQAQTSEQGSATPKAETRDFINLTLLIRWDFFQAAVQDQQLAAGLLSLCSGHITQASSQVLPPFTAAVYTSV